MKPERVFPNVSDAEERLVKKNGYFPLTILFSPIKPGLPAGHGYRPIERLMDLIKDVT